MPKKQRMIFATMMMFVHLVAMASTGILDDVSFTSWIPWSLAPSTSSKSHSMVKRQDNIVHQVADITCNLLDKEDGFQLHISWTVPEEDVSFYEVRYGTQELSDINFENGILAQTSTDVNVSQAGKLAFVLTDNIPILKLTTYHAAVKICHTNGACEVTKNCYVMYEDIPERIKDLDCKSIINDITQEQQLVLTWTVPGDVEVYQVRYSRNELSNINWESGAQVLTPELPHLIPGDQATVTTVPFNISRGIHYYAAIKATHVQGVLSIVSYPCMFGIDAGITDLRVNLLRIKSDDLYQIMLMWHPTSIAHSYEVRLATWSLTEDNFIQGEIIESTSVTSAACDGLYQFISEPMHLLNNTHYSIAVKTSWDDGLNSAISNTVALNIANAIVHKRVTDFSFKLIPQLDGDLHQLKLTWTIPKGASHYKVLYSQNEDLSSALTLTIPNNKLIACETQADIITQPISIQPEKSYYFALQVLYDKPAVCMLSNMESTNLFQDLGPIDDLTAEVIPNITTNMAQLKLSFTPPFDVESYDIHYGNYTSNEADLLGGPLLKSDIHKLYANKKATVLVEQHNFELAMKFGIIVKVMNNEGIHNHSTVSNVCEFQMDEGFSISIEDLEACLAVDPKTHLSQISLVWTGSPQVQSYEVRFSEHLLNKENFESGAQIPVADLVNLTLTRSESGLGVPAFDHLNITSEPFNIPKDIVYYVHLKAMYGNESLISNGAKIINEDTPERISDLECTLVQTENGSIPRLELQWTVPNRVLQYEFAYWQDQFENISSKQDDLAWSDVEDVTYFHATGASTTAGATAHYILEDMNINKDKRYAVAIDVLHKKSRAKEGNTGCNRNRTIANRYKMHLSSNICKFILVDYPDVQGDLIVFDIYDLLSHDNDYGISLEWKINNKGLRVIDYEIRYSTAWFNQSDFNTAILIGKEGVGSHQQEFMANITDPIFHPDITYYVCVKVIYTEISYSIFSNTVNFTNQILPKNIKDLVATVEINDSKEYSIYLNWTVPYKVLDYEVRYSKHLITGVNFLQSTSIEISRQPSKVPGEVVSVKIIAAMLQPQTLYYIVLKVKHQGLFERLLSNVVSIKTPNMEDSDYSYVLDKTVSIKKPNMEDSDSFYVLDKTEKKDFIKPLIISITDFSCEAAAAQNTLYQLECSWTIPDNVSGYEIWYSSNELCPSKYTHGSLVDTFDTQWCRISNTVTQNMKNCTYPGVSGEKAKFKSWPIRLQCGTQYYALLRIKLTTHQWLFSNINEFLIEEKERLPPPNIPIPDLSVCPKGPNYLSLSWTVPCKVTAYSICFNDNPSKLPDLEFCEPWSQPGLLVQPPGTHVDAFVTGNFVKKALETAKTFVCIRVEYENSQSLFSNVEDLKQDIVTMYRWMYNEGVDIESPLMATACVDSNNESHQTKVILQWVAPFDESYYEFHMSVDETFLMPDNFALAPIIYIPELAASDKVFTPAGELVCVETYLNLTFGKRYFIGMQVLDESGKRSEPWKAASFVVTYC